MTDAEITAALEAIRAESEPNLKHFRVASLLSELFRAEGADPIVVGGSAVYPPWCGTLFFSGFPKGMESLNQLLLIRKEGQQRNT